MQELLHYLRMIKRSWWIVALTALTALNIALLASYLSTPMYQATARLIVSPGPSLLAGEDKDLVSSLEALDKRSIVATYVEVINSRRVLRESRDELGLSAEEMADYEVSAVVLPDASVLQLSVVGPNPETTARLANDLSQRAVAYIENLYLVYNISLFDQATLPKSPISPQPARNAAVAVVLGVVLGAVLALVREHLRQPLDTVRDRMNMDKHSLAYSRRYFKNRLDEELMRHQAGNLSLGVIELEGLPDWQETLSKPAYQRLLRRIKGILQDEMRGKDVIGRWDETSFAVLLPGTSGSTAIQQFESVQQALLQPITLDEDQTVQLKPYTGVAALQEDERYAAALIEHAETALNRAHRTGRNVILFTRDVALSYASAEHKNGSNAKTP